MWKVRFMKKLGCKLIVLWLAFCLCGCGAQDGETENSDIGSSQRNPMHTSGSAQTGVESAAKSNAEPTVEDPLADWKELDAARNVTSLEFLKWKVNDEGNVEIKGYKEGLPAEVVIPNVIEGGLVVTIERDAFSGCETLTRMDIPESVTSIERQAFLNCINLAEVTTGPKAHMDILKNAFYGTPWLEQQLTTVGYAQLGHCLIQVSADVTAFSVPEEITSIAEYAFSKCNQMVSVDLPEGITDIKEGTFWDCAKLEHIDIPDSVTEIEANAFIQCYGLQSVNFPESLTAIGFEAFRSCGSLKSIVLPNGLEKISGSAFIYCSALEDIQISENTVLAGEGVFGGTAWEQKFADNEYIMLNKILYDVRSDVTEFTFPQGAVSIASGAFSSCENLTTLEIPEGVVYIGSDAFSGCSNLSKVVIPEGVTVIGARSFENCTSLTSIELPASVQTIQVQAFKGCTGLTNVKVSATADIDKYAFKDCTQDITFEKY